MGSQQFCLKWNNHQLNMLTVFDQLLQNEAFVDVTIACEGLSLKAHKMVLSACSPYFQNLFMDNPCKHPIVILKDIRYDEMKAIIDFMYKGEVNVSQDQLSALLKTAEALKVKGLAEVTGQGPHGQSQQGGSQSSVLFETVGSRHSPPAKRKKRPPASTAVSIGSPASPGNSNTSHSTSSHRALSPPHPVVQSAVSLAPVPTSSAASSGMCSGDDEPLAGLDRLPNMEGVPGSSKDNLRSVKEEKIELDEPPDDVEDLIMEATPEHIEIEPSTTDTGFNGSTQDQSQLSNIKYGNIYNPVPSTSGTSPGILQMTTRSRDMQILPVQVSQQPTLQHPTFPDLPPEPAPQNMAAGNGMQSITLETKVQIIQLLDKGEMTQAKIAQRFGIGTTSVQRLRQIKEAIMKEYREQLPKPNQQHPTGASIMQAMTLETKVQIIRLVNKGVMSQRQIAQRFGIGRWSVLTLYKNEEAIMKEYQRMLKRNQERRRRMRRSAEK